MIESILASKAFKKAGGQRKDYYRYVLEKAPQNGLWLEFGVSEGTTATTLCRYRRGIVYGFDSFEGLPEDWDTGGQDGVFKKGSFSVSQSKINKMMDKIDNLSLVVGLFEETLPRFLSEHKDNCALIHIDCDLYSSTKTVLDHLEPRIVPGTVIMFDEIHFYPNYAKHEYRAFEEFLKRTGMKVEWVAHCSNAPQATCIVAET